MAFDGEVVASIAGGVWTSTTSLVVAHRRLLTKLELIWSALTRALMIVHQVVLETHNDERYVVEARFGDSFQSNAFFDDGLCDFTEVQMCSTELLHSTNNLILGIAAMNAVRGQYEEVILWSDLHGASLRLRDDQLLHFEVTESSRDAQFTIDAVMEYRAIVSLNSEPFGRTLRCVLHIKLAPSAFFLDKSGNGVSNVGNSESAVKNEAHKSG